MKEKNFDIIEKEIAAIVTGLYQSPDVVHYPYHNLAHTESVVRYAKEIADHYLLPQTDCFILKMSAWFHDIGHLYGEMKGHEERGVAIMQHHLAAVSADIRDAIGRCILATKLPSHPADLREQIICDADTYHLGTPIFCITDPLVQKEMEIRTGKSFPDWHRKSLQLLEGHSFFTEYCQRLLEYGLKENIAWLRAQIDPSGSR